MDDATPQSLVSLMNKNRGKISILTAEGDFFERFKNKNIDQVKYDVYLKPYSGDLLRTDRISRDTEIIENPNMTICVTAQPSVIKNLPSTVHDRGLMARFSYFIPYDNLGYRDSRTLEIPKHVIDSYEKIIYKLLSWTTEDTISLKLSKDATDLLHDTMDEIEVEFREDGAFHDNLKGWAGKLIGQLLRIAGLLHVSNQAQSCDQITDVNNTINKDTLASAILLKNYLVAHAEKAFGLMQQSQPYENAEYVLYKIRNLNSPIIPKQTIHQNTKSKLKGKENLHQAFDILEYHSYIRQVVGGKSGTRGFVWVIRSY